jgi:hypothetical protein
VINELINELVEDRKNFVSSLRKGKLIASELGISEMKEWLKYELEGYWAEVSLPEYRKLHVQSLGTFSGPFGSGVKNVVLPTLNLPDFLRDFAENYFVHESISELNELVVAKEGKLTRKWPAEIIIASREYIQMSGGQVLIDAEQMLSKSMFTGIIENSKNKLLDFLIELKEAGVDSSKPLTESTSAKVRNIFNVNVYGSHNVVASGENVNQSDIVVKAGDFESLSCFLKNIGIGKSEIEELKHAVDADGSRKRAKFGEKVNLWLGQMLGKIFEGAISATLQVTPALLVEGLKKFYGG